MNEWAVAEEASIPLDLAGRRFDQALAEMFPQHSRSRLATWIRSGAARLDGAIVQPRQVVHGGERVSLAALPEQVVSMAAEAIPLQVLHADRDVIVLDKPAGLVVHPGAGVPQGTLQNALLHYDPELATIPRAGIVHRLDKDTSGVLVVARSLRAHTSLVAQLAARSVQRQYLALVYGTMIAGGMVDAPIGRHPRDRLRQAVRADGREAVTHYRVRERFRSMTLVECRLETGRTHQIRVHLAHLRHPLVGDGLYGGLARLPKGASAELVAVLRSFRRQALHAERLGFVHPHTGKPMEFVADLPADMQELLSALRAEECGRKS